MSSFRALGRVALEGNLLEGPLKSQSLDDFVLGLYLKLLDDLKQFYPEIKESLCRDAETIRIRMQREGLSFVTKTLPKLGKEFDMALDTGILTPPKAFKKAKGSDTIPAFLQGMYRMLFDLQGNLVRETVSVIRDLRQIFYLVYKLELPYSEKQKSEVIARFLQNEKDLSELVLSEDDLVSPRSIISRILVGFDPKNITPRHGPGSVATGEVGDKKWLFSRKYPSIHSVYPYYEYFVVGGSRELLDRLQWYKSLKPLDKGVAKVVLVPKDSRGPRLISCEPLEFQWIQQGLNAALVRHLEENSLSKGQINFADQTCNRQLALESSRHHAFSTIDLKDASDRVSLELMKRLFPSHLIKYFEAVRSHSTKLPDGSVIDLLKYAPMGSAVCFSVEALIFWSVAVGAVAKFFSWSYSDAAPSVFCYGDDIIVPTVAFEAVVAALESVGLIVNRQKCCSNGSFRESCGMDAYSGFDVTPTKISTCWSSSTRSPQRLAAYASYANSFAKKGYATLAAYIRTHITSLYGFLPYGTSDSGYPCVAVEDRLEAALLNGRAGARLRFNAGIQQLELRAWTLHSQSAETSLEGWPRLLRQQVGLSGRDPDRVVLPRRTVIRKRWVVVR